MKSLFVMLILASGVCAASPKFPDCERVANFAQSVAVIRESGVTESELQSWVSEPTVQKFPIALVKHQIYAYNLNHKQAYDVFYDKCVTVGFEYLFQSMKDADELAMLREQYRTLNSRYAEQSWQLSALANKLSQVPAVSKPIPTYGEPIDGRVVTH